jgi:hypothetical protein
VSRTGIVSRYCVPDGRPGRFFRVRSIGFRVQDHHLNRKGDSGGDHHDRHGVRQADRGIDAQRRDGLITWDEAAANKLALKIERGAVVYIAMNEDADYEVGASEDEATDRLSESIGGRLGRVVRLVVRMSPPKAEDAGGVTIPDMAGETVTCGAA